MSLTNFKGKFLTTAGSQPEDLNAKAADHRVNGRSHAVASKNFLCCWLFMVCFLMDDSSIVETCRVRDVCDGLMVCQKHLPTQLGQQVAALQAVEHRAFDF
jgi:hypothetical protein